VSPGLTVGVSVTTNGGVSVMNNVSVAVNVILGVDEGIKYVGVMLGVTLIVGVSVIVGVSNFAVGCGRVALNMAVGAIDSAVIVGVGVAFPFAPLLIHKIINPSR